MAFDGSYVSARLTGSTVRLVSSSYPAAGPAELGHGRALMPRGDRARPGHRRPAHAARWSAAAPSGGRRGSPAAGMLTVLTIDLRRGLPAVDADAVLTDGEIVYASTDRPLRRHRALDRRAPTRRARRCEPRSTASTPPTPMPPTTSPAAR